MGDYVADKRGAALGARLRRLSARVDTDVARVYATCGIQFEQRWFGVINQLALNGAMSVSALADALGISHPSVSEARRLLEKAGLVRSEPDPADSRSQAISLTPTGETLVHRLRPLWRLFDEIAEELDAEAGGVTEALGQLEQALACRSLHARITDRMDQ